MRRLVAIVLSLSLILWVGNFQLIYAALSANTVWEVETGGSDTNGGGFVTGSSGTDYSQQASANPNGGNNGSSVLGSSAGTTTLTCSDCSFTSAITGNIIYVAGGSGSITAQWRQVTYASATTVTMDTTIASSSGMTINIGGALLSPGIATKNATVAQMTIYIKYGSFTITSASTNVAGGCMTSSVQIYVIGYNTNRTLTNTDSMPTLTLNSGVSSATIYNNSTYSVIRNIAFNGASQTTSKGITGNFTIADRCTFTGFTSAADAAWVTVRSAATANSSTPFTGTGAIIGTESYANTASGFATTGLCLYCLGYNNTGGSSDGIDNGTTGVVVNSTFYGNGRDGIEGTGGNQGFYLNNIVVNNGRYGHDLTGGLRVYFNDAVYGNVSGESLGSGKIFALPQVTITTSPFVNGGAGNLSLNSMAGGGPSVRQVAYPGTFESGSNTSYLDVGGIQHPNPTIATVQ